MKDGIIFEFFTRKHLTRLIQNTYTNMRQTKKYLTVFTIILFFVLLIISGFSLKKSMEIQKKLQKLEKQEQFYNLTK